MVYSKDVSKIDELKTIYEIEFIRNHGLLKIKDRTSSGINIISWNVNKAPKKDDVFSSSSFRFEKIGRYACDNAPSAKSFLKLFGMLYEKFIASAIKPAPKKDEIALAFNIPNKRDMKVVIIIIKVFLSLLCAIETSHILFLKFSKASFSNALLNSF